jgi:hypothetical protein
VDCSSSPRERLLELRRAVHARFAHYQSSPAFPTNRMLFFSSERSRIDRFAFHWGEALDQGEVLTSRVGYGDVCIRYA